jgi:hypothetical protein
MVPQFPVELLEKIIWSTWHMPLSFDERITFMRSSMLVNSTWADVFDLVSSRDVYIPSFAFTDHFIQRLRAQAPAITTCPSSFLSSLLRGFRPTSKTRTPPRSANEACQSLTIQLANVEIHSDTSKHTPARLPMGAVLDDLLENLDARSLAPNLRHLTIEYLDAGVDDIFHRVGLAALPANITHLEVRYSFSGETPVPPVDPLREKEGRQRRIGWVSRSVTNLSVRGAGESTISDLLRACPNVQAFDVDGVTRRPKVDIAHVCLITSICR